MYTEPDQLLKNAIDMHSHCYPEIALECRMRMEDEDALRLAQEAGMQAVVLKSHFWPTIGKAYELRKLVPGIKVFGSITLNPAVGGINPWVVESAAKQGAKVVWMPTWSTAITVKQGWNPLTWKKHIPTLQRFYELYKGREEELSTIDSAGKLKADVAEVIRLIKEFDLVLSTGHLSRLECLAIAEECQKIGLKKLIWGHPVGRDMPALEELKEMADLDVFIEFTTLSTFTITWVERRHPNDIVKVINEVGYQNCILTSDAFSVYVPPPSEMLRMLIAMLLELGVDVKAIKTMVHDNPAKLLGLDSGEAPTLDPEGRLEFGSVQI